MRGRKLLNRFVAVALFFSTTFVTMPVSAAELAPARTTLGSVNGSGLVSLRGVKMLQEGTIFDGDVVEVGSNGYARVVLVAGHRLELDANTKVSIRQVNDNISVQVTAGNVAFTRSDAAALTVSVGPYEIKPERRGSGSAAFVGGQAVGLRSIQGALAVRQMTSRATYTLPAGQERIFMFSGQSAQPLAQVASTVPTAMPAVPPIPQTAPAGRGLTATGWIAILATVGGAATAVAVLATRGDKEDTSFLLTKQRAVQGTQAAITSAQQAQTTAQQIANAAATVNNALNTVPDPTTRAQLQAQASTIASSANAVNSQVAGLLTQLSSLLTQLQNAQSQTDVASLVSQVNGLIAQLNVHINTINNLITQLQNVIQSGRNAGGTIPDITIQPVPRAGTVFASPVTP
jgi:DnaJ-domain-containing protein 1